MRRVLAVFLSAFLFIGFLAPSSSMAKEEKKSPPKSIAEYNAKNPEGKPTTPTPNDSKRDSKESTSSTSTAPVTSHGNSGNASNNSTSNQPGTSTNSSEDKKSETTGRPAETGKPLEVGKPDTTNKKDITLEASEVKNFVVRFRDDVSIATEATNLRAQEARVSRTFSNVFKGLSATLNAKQLDALKKNPRVEVIEEDIEVRTAEVQTDATWGLDRIDQRALPLDNSFTYTSFGSSVRAYVIDTGLRASHQEFLGRIQSGFTAISDGRGTEDCNGHGTHVAGTIAGTTFGVAKFATVVPIRVLGCDGSGTLSGVIAGLDWVAANHSSGTAAVANMSLGAGASSTLDSAVNNLINRGITVVVAAGNNSASACNYSPARVPAAITVAASTITDRLSSFSNHGSCIDLVAPGSSITSAWINSDVSIATLDGTSMASPHVAGAVISLFSNGYLSPANVVTRIKSLATTGVFASLPSGTPNALLYAGSGGSDDLVTPPAVVITIPAAPTELVASPGRRSALLSWKLSSNDGGSPITSQVISVITGGKVSRTLAVTGTTTAANVRSLSTKLSYTFTVQAVNAIGTGPASTPSNAITPLP